MGAIVLLAFGAAFFPTLLACVAIMITQPEPRPLLLSFYAGGLLTSLASGLVVLKIFSDGDEVLGTTTSTPDPATSIITGVVALLLAWLAASTPGKARIDRWRTSRAHDAAPDRDKRPSWAERHLGQASAKVAFVVGAAINLPGPFYLLALGDIATGGYSTAQQLGLVLLFNAIMFLLLEAPLVGYIVRPEATAERVAALSRWLDANGLRVTGWLVGVLGAGLLAEGFAALAG